MTTEAKIFIAAILALLLACVAVLADELGLIKLGWPEMPAIVIISAAGAAELDPSPGRTRLGSNALEGNAAHQAAYVPAQAPAQEEIRVYLVTEQQMRELADVTARMQAVILKQQMELERIRTECEQPVRQTP